MSAWSESIYNWIPKKEEVAVKPARYRSKHDPTVPPTGSTFGLHGSTKIPGAGLGEKLPKIDKSSKVIKSARPEPTEFLKKGTGETLKPKREAVGTRSENTKPSVPSRAERPVMGLTTSKNFVVANAVENILSIPKPLTSGPVDYTKKPDYGRVPEYIGKVKQQIAEEKELIAEYFADEKEEDEVGDGETLSDADREKLLLALKQKWDDVNHRFQRMAHNTKLDTIGKVRRKETLEAQLEEIEKSIKLLSDKRPIVVADR